MIGRKNYFLIITIAIMAIAGSLGIRPVRATPTPTPVPSTQPSPTDINSDLRAVIRQEVQSHENQPTEQPKKIGLVGTITALEATGNLITVATARQGSVIASASAKTTFIRVNDQGIGRQVKIDNAAIGDNIIAIGVNNPSTNDVIAQKVILFTTPEPKRFVIMGNLTQVSATSLTVQPAKQPTTVQINSASSTDYESLTNSQDTNPIRRSSLGTNDRLIVAGTYNNRSPQADLVVLLASASAGTTPAK